MKPPGSLIVGNWLRVLLLVVWVAGSISHRLE